MATNFPTALDTYVARVDYVDDVMADHINTDFGAVVALETKIGTGASTPTAGTILAGSGTGTSAWTASPSVTGTVTSKQSGGIGIALNHNSAAGGNFTLSLVPASLTANRTVTFPDAAMTFTGGGTLALGGYTLTVPATGTAALLGTSNNFTVTQYINDTANTKMTLGLTLNQGANDDEILAFKSSDVAHAMTTQTEADTFGLFKKASATAGGLVMRGIGEGADGLTAQGFVTTGNTTKSTSGTAPTIFSAGKHNGSGDVTSMGADENLVVFSEVNVGTRFIFDREGDSHEDGTGWTAYDDHDDIQLLNLVNTALTKRDPVKSEFWSWVKDNAQQLQDLKLITFNADGHHFINRSKMQELLVGAVRQLGNENKRLNERIERIERLSLAGGVQ